MNGFNRRAVGQMGRDYVDPKKINPNKWSLRYNPPMDWRGIKYNNHWFGMTHLLQKTHEHFNTQDFFQKGSGPRNHEKQHELPRYRKALEIGSYMGEAAQMMMASGIFDELHIIDPWAGREEANEIFSETWESVLEKCGRNLSPWHDKVSVYRGLSHEIYQQFMDNDFDFVYIDGGHDYNQVIRDITLYNRKLKHSGVMAGNDYQLLHGKHSGVTKAVDEFYDKENITRFVDSSWWTVKPRLKYL
tara:strand:+ start:3400 stop:4134 length:735 start_codon:yes stop_codon:yes gene_type:complete